MSCPPTFVNYLVLQVSDTEAFTVASEEQILPSSTKTFSISGTPGTTKFVRAKWRRTTDPLEESGWSEVLEIAFPLTGTGGGNGNGGEEICGPQQSGLVLQFDGTQAVAQTLASLRCPFRGFFTSWFIDVNPAESSGTNILQVRKNGANIFASAWRPAISAPNLTTTGNVFAIATFEKDDLIQMDVEQIGTTGPRRITLQIQIQRICEGEGPPIPPPFQTYTISTALSVQTSQAISEEHTILGPQTFNEAIVLTTKTAVPVGDTHIPTGSQSYTINTSLVGKARI